MPPQMRVFFSLPFNVRQISIISPCPPVISVGMKHAPQFTEVIYEYEVIPAPTKAKRVAGLIKENERVAHEISELFNDMAIDGWEYVRADTISIDDVTGISGNIPKAHTLLVFRRPLIQSTTDAVEALMLKDRIA
ncbi:hypothetical protein SAMN05444004_10613 [Jannaschia faecimaris]|uniref:DUF4177 domain-containing protein n=2 Tax=Jannaschia faecimaris TaxID=1244108 RepID=A0A1H3Q7X3_9RHOB|nr:hypothetical protein SAMN05444004_10613 [Jannaschia faecimaris]